ncbi:MAG: intradiol ring-cleavage dioxygenase [Bryobacteraceae bacterium]
MQRRELLQHGLQVVSAWVLTETGWAACESGHSTDPSQEGPFYRAGAPDRTALAERGMKGTPLVVSGTVSNDRCEPLRDAVLDVWHANADGAYDNQGFTLRGKIHTDAKGRYEFATIVPVPYQAGRSVRAAHIHLKVSGAGTPVLTTEIYFENDPYAKTDRLWKPSLVMPLREGSNGSRSGRFDFRLRTNS